MKRTIITLMLVFCTGIFACAKISLTSLRANHLDTPAGINPNVQPVLSWVIGSDKKNTVQTAYQISVSTSGHQVWNSGCVKSDNSIAVPYKGPLKSGTQYKWAVTVWDNNGCKATASSTWSTGLRKEDWKAQWIGAQRCNRPIYLKTLLNAYKSVKRATAYVSARGIYQIQLNCKTVGKDVCLPPGWTSYNHRVQYQAYDITKMVKRGANSIHAIVVPGWYSGGINWGDPSKRFRYGEDVALLMQIVLEFTDGTTCNFCTSRDWMVSETGPIRCASIYDGQTIDLTEDLDWKPVEYIRPCRYENLVPCVSEPVRRRTAIKPVASIVTPKGEKVIDFGQNITGWEKVRLNGPKGTKVTIRHAEILDPDGNFYTENLREAKAVSTYVLNGKGPVTLEPNLTFYGFRYICVEGLPGALNLSDFEAVPICSGFEDSGSFLCSDDTINQLQSNIFWSFHDNFVDVPTDCPQRDERLGWTGDAQVFFRTASFLGRVENFFSKWLADLSCDQREDGGIPRVIPDTFPESNARVGATGWADCATIIPWNHYMAYGDKTVLSNQYESMKRWVDFCIRNAEYNDWLLNTNLERHYGDWLSYHKINDPDGQSAVTSKALVAQSFFIASARIVARTAAILGRKDEASYYEKVTSYAKDAFMNEYVTPNGLISSDTQTAYVLALNFDILPEDMRQKAADRLVANIKRYDYHITTGFLGTPYICGVLTRFGYSDIAYKLLFQKTCPSWIYPVSKGATTIWERWDSIQPDGTILKGMNSFNHYSLGAIGDWLYRDALGIKEAVPGYKIIEIRPHAGGGITWMQGRTSTPYGPVAVKWTAENETITTLEVDVPVGSRARVYKGNNFFEVGSGHHLFK